MIVRGTVDGRVVVLHAGVVSMHEQTVETTLDADLMRDAREFKYCAEFVVAARLALGASVIVVEVVAIVIDGNDPDADYYLWLTRSSSR